jgi:hypothetical protein
MNKTPQSQRARYNAPPGPRPSKAKQCQTDPAEYKYA